MPTAPYHPWIVLAGGRRFLMAVGAGIVSSALLIFHYIDQTVYTTLILSTVGAYIGASTYQKVKGGANGTS